MLNNFKAKLNSDYGLQQIMNELCKPSFALNLSTQDLAELTQIVQGKPNNYKLHPKVEAALYSIIVMRGYTNYNTKIAIETLSKNYRSLQSEEHSQSAHPNKSRQVIANLLIRIPTFSNYKLILKDLKPRLLPASILIEHRDRIYKQCPNIYKDHLLKEHKHEWPTLIIGDEQNYPLHDDFKSLKEKLISLSSLKTLIQLSDSYAELQKDIEFLKGRINQVSKEEVDIEILFKEIKDILTFNKSFDAEERIMQFQTISKTQSFIHKTKTAVVELLNELVKKFKSSLYRKFNELSVLLKDLYEQDYSATSIDPASLISLFTTLLTVYGIGFYDFNAIVHTDNISCLSLLVSALCFNDYSKNNKNTETLLNYQSKSKNQKKQSSQININLYNTTVIDTAYETYLKKTTPYQREYLLSQILKFLFKFYEAKSETASEFYQSSQILSSISNSKNEISQRNLGLVKNIKDKVLFKGFNQTGEHFEQFCENVFTTYIKKRKQNKFEIVQVQQIFIEPVLRQNNKDSFVSFASRPAQNNPDSNSLKRTNSFDVHHEGWATQEKKVEKKNEANEQKGSQMFYSIQQSSQIDKNIEKQGNEESEEVFITPQF